MGNYTIEQVDLPGVKDVRSFMSVYGCGVMREYPITYDTRKRVIQDINYLKNLVEKRLSILPMGCYEYLNLGKVGYRVLNLQETPTTMDEYTDFLVTRQKYNQRMGGVSKRLPTNLVTLYNINGEEMFKGTYKQAQSVALRYLKKVYIDTCGTLTKCLMFRQDGVHTCYLTLEDISKEFKGIETMKVSETRDFVSINRYIFYKMSPAD